MLTVLTWLWSQPGSRTVYTPLHVQIWAAMIRRHLSIPHRLACVTNEPVNIEGVEIIRPPSDFENVRIPSWPEHRPQCLRRLSMFRPDAGGIFGEEILCTDLDMVAGDSLDPLVPKDRDFQIAVGTATDRPYNGSLVYIRAGRRAQVFQEFTAAGAVAAGSRFLGSDQAWIAHCLGPDEPTWGEDDGLTYHGLPRKITTVRRVTFFPGANKPWHLLRDPWIGRNYRMEREGRCLVLGYDENTLWADVERALDEGPVAAVIASPEAAEHWPGEILAIARTNRQASELARMYGFDGVVFCGVDEREAA